MVKTKIRFVDIFYCIALIAVDVLIYIILGILQMDYDDNYDISKGEYWSLQSMNNRQLIFYFLLQLWHILNVIALIFIGIKIFKRIKCGT
jgi:hypothetical protein